MALHGLLTTFRSLRERLTPVLTATQLERGLLTPAEFVAAGDALVAASPSWAWEGGDPPLQRPYLPAAKQFLVTRGVPCARRVGDAAVEDAAAAAAAGDGHGVELAGADTESAASGAGGRRRAPGPGLGGAAKPAPSDYEDVGAAVAALRQSPRRRGGGRASPASTEAPAAAATRPPTTPAPGSAAAADGFDIASLEDPAVAAVVDPAAAAPALRTRPAPATTGAQLTVPAPAAATSSTTPDRPPEPQLRRYDLYVTYDNYYRTPRVYLAGVDAATGGRLSPGAMLEDVATDYANTTATVEAHPHLARAGPVLSVHPCKHAAAMRALLAGVGLLPAGAAAEGGGSGDGGAALSAPAAGPTAAVDEAAVLAAYLPLFVKLLGTMLPTLDYDFTGVGELGSGSGGHGHGLG